MPTFPEMNLVAPTVGGSSGAWATLLNQCLQQISAHSHQSGEGVKITPAAIDINANLSLASNSLTNIRSLAFSSGQAVSGSRLLYVGADNELYWNNNASGAAIKITDGASLNVAGFIGGIGGDYTAVAAELNYDDALDRYTFTMAGGTTWARIAAGELRIHEHNTIVNSYVALASPSGLAGSYTLTFPGALPAAKRLVQVSAAGVMTFDNTGVEATTFTGLVTASAGVTCAADQHVTVSGTGDVKHGDREIVVSASHFVAAGTDSVTAPSLSDYWTFGSPPRDTIQGGIHGLRAGDRIKSITWHFNKGSSASALVMALRSRNGTTNTAIDSLSDVSSGAAFTSATQSSINYTIASGDAMFLRVQAGNTAHQFSHAIITYDHP